MARLASKARMGFVPLPCHTTDGDPYQVDQETGEANGLPAHDVAKMIGSYIAPAPKHVRILDPCAGEGVALGIISEALDIPKSHRYANEWHDERSEACKSHADNVHMADAVNDLQCARWQFQVAYVNPPFDDDDQAQGGGRLEGKFFNRIVDEGGWLQPGGIMVIVTPQDVLLRDITCHNHLARWYDNLTIVAVPSDIRHFREAIVIGVLRETKRKGGEFSERLLKIKEVLGKQLKPITFQAKPRYQVPNPAKINTLIWRRPSLSTADVAIRDIVKMGGAWGSVEHERRMKEARTPRTFLNPLFPLSKVQAALRVADGTLNNKEIRLAGRKMRIKGRTLLSTKTWTETKKSDKGEVSEKHELKMQVPHITTVDQETGAIGQYIGDEGVAKLMDHPDAAQGLIGAIEETIPPVYRMQLPEDVDTILSGIVSLSGRALPGYQPGFIRMQRHLVAACVKGFTDKQKNGTVWRNLLLSAEMGCGKSSMAYGTAESLRLLAPTNGKNRAFTVLLVAPNHLIGERATVEEYDELIVKGKKPKLALDKIAPHLAEFRDLLPNWATEILETPSQVAAFYRKAQQDPKTPRIGFMSYSKFSLASGREIGINRHYEARKALTPQGAMLIEQCVARDEHELETRLDLLKLEKKQAQRKHNANGDENDDRSTLEKKPGVTERTLRRDRMLRAGVAHIMERANQGQTLPGQEDVHPLLQKRVRMCNMVAPGRHWAGLFCPKCGRIVAKKNGDVHTEQSLYKAGLISCLFCGETLGQMNRSQDSTGDREIPLFSSPEYLNGQRTTVRSIPVLQEVQTPDDEFGHVTDWEPTGEVIEEEIEVPWQGGKRPTSNPRMALAEFIARRFHGKTDLFIADEAHMCKGRDTERGSLLGKMISASHRTLGLTGTLYGGKASTVFSLLMRFGNPELKRLYSWSDELQFVRDLGVVDEITKTYTSEAEAKKMRGKAQKEIKQTVERAGITPRLASIIQQQAVIIRLEQMGFNLKGYDESVQFMELPYELRSEYSKLVAEGKAILREKGGRDALSSYLQACLTYCVAPWKPMTIRSKKADLEYTPPEFPEGMILPHHHWLAQEAAESTRAGRRMIVFVEHTNRLDIMPDIQKKIIQLAKEEYGTDIKVAILRSTTVSPGARAGWFAAREDDGTTVVLCHPKLIETGLNLIGWADLRFAEITYQLATAMQARKRSRRPTQTKDVTVVWGAYQGTMMEQAIGIIGKKATAAALLAGDNLTSGLLQFDEGMSLLQQLAKQVDADDNVSTSLEDVQQLFAQAAQAVVKEMSQDISELVGVGPHIIKLDPLALELPMGTPTLELSEDFIEDVPEVLVLPEALSQRSRGFGARIKIGDLPKRLQGKALGGVDAEQHTMW